MEPVFDASLYPWLEAGGGIAVAGLRGGGEYGEAWHRAGAREHKQNVFDDFIAAAEHLVGDGYTAPRWLAIEGGSNGGLLVGAASPSGPSCSEPSSAPVPLLDMVRYHPLRRWPHLDLRIRVVRRRRRLRVVVRLLSLPSRPGRHLLPTGAVCLLRLRRSSRSAARP